MFIIVFRENLVTLGRLVLPGLVKLKGNRTTTRRDNVVLLGKEVTQACQVATVYLETMA